MQVEPHEVQWNHQWGVPRNGRLVSVGAGSGRGPAGGHSNKNGGKCPGVFD